MRNSIWKICLSLLVLTNLFSCAKNDEDVRTPDDILGVWSPSDSEYLECSTGNYAHLLNLIAEGEETVGVWVEDVYFYEPGYELVIYIDHSMTLTVYKIVSMSRNKMTWCWVEDMKVEEINREMIGQMIGHIINQAQEGFDLDPELYQTYTRVSWDDFLDILDSLDVTYPYYVN